MNHKRTPTLRYILQGSHANYFSECHIEHALGSEPATAEKLAHRAIFTVQQLLGAGNPVGVYQPLEVIRSSCSPHYSGRSYSCRKQKNTYITINQQCNYQIKNYSVYWLSIEGLNKFLYIINGGQFARIITFIEDRKGFLLFQNAP